MNLRRCQSVSQLRRLRISPRSVLKAFSEVDSNAYSLVMSTVIVAGNASLDPDYDQLCEERYHHAAMAAGYTATGA